MNWFEDPSFWEAMKPLTFSERTVSGGQREVELLESMLESEFGLKLGSARILDMPCGVGRHSTPMARAGARVTALDFHEPFINDARERAAAAGVDVRFVVGDMHEADFDAEFELAVNLYTSFGYKLDDDEDRRLFEVYRRALRPGGVLVLDTLSTEVLAPIFEPVRYVETPEGVAQWKARVGDEWRRMDVEVRVFSDGVTRTTAFSHRIYSAGELRSMLRDAGFDDVRVRGGLSGRDFGPGAGRCVVLARVPSP